MQTGSETEHRSLQSRRGLPRRRHFVYILRCSNGDLYTGYTPDPERRFRLHNLGLASKFTRSRLPVELMHVEAYRIKSLALKREVAIKKLSRIEKLELCSRSSLRERTSSEAQ